jgi:ribosome-binding factor A
MSRRTERLGSTIQQELAQIIMRELSDPRLTGMPSITRVKVSEDLSIADVYMTIMGTEGQQNAALNALRHSAGLMRTRLTKMLSLRQSPFLKFHIDENLKKELAVLDLLDKVRKENEEIDRKRAAEAAGANGAVPETDPSVTDADADTRPGTDAVAAPAEPAGDEALPPPRNTPE